MSLGVAVLGCSPGAGPVAVGRQALHEALMGTYAVWCVWLFVKVDDHPAGRDNRLALGQSTENGRSVLAGPGALLVAEYGPGAVEADASAQGLTDHEAGRQAHVAGVVELADQRRRGVQVEFEAVLGQDTASMAVGK